MNSINKIIRLIKDGDYKNAEELLQDHIKTPDNRDAHFLFGVVLAKTGRFEEAEEQFLHLVEKDKTDIEALGSLAVVYRHQGKLKDALGVFNEALELDQTRADFYYHIGSIQLLEGELKAAFMSYAKVIEFDPNYASAYNNLGIVYYESNDFNKAVNILKQGISLSKNSAEIHYNYGIALNAAGRFEDAVREYGIVLKLRPMWTSALNNLGIAQANLGLIDEAGGSFDLILDEDPFNPEAWNNMGAIFVKQGAKEDALSNYHHAVELRPEYENAKRNIESVEQATGEDPLFSLVDMIIDEDIDIPINIKQEAEPLEGSLLGFSVPDLLDFFKHLKEMISFLPQGEQDVFAQSNIRFNIDHIINTFEGHKGIFKEIQERKAVSTISATSIGDEPAEKTPLKTAEVAEFLSYLNTLTESLPNESTVELLSKKMRGISKSLSAAQ